MTLHPYLAHIAEDGPDQTTFWGHINRVALGKSPPCDGWRNEVTLPVPPPMPQRVHSWHLMFDTWMLYSCLADIDYLDTKSFMTRQSRKSVSNVTIGQLWEKLQNYTAA